MKGASYEFHRDPKLGVGGGVICYVIDGKKEIRGNSLHSMSGEQPKFIGKTVGSSIGGLLAAPGWDTMDEVKANSLGWSTRSFPHLHLVHQSDTGAVDGIMADYVKYGRANYICGYHPLFMIANASCV